MGIFSGRHGWRRAFGPIGLFSAQREEGKDEAAQREAEGISTGQSAQKKVELESLRKEYQEMPETLRTKYTQDAQRAGTFSTSPEFDAGLNSEVQAGLRGSRAGTQSRINALERELGETVTPYETTTQANVGGVPGSTATLAGQTATSGISTTPNALSSSGAADIGAAEKRDSLEGEVDPKDSARNRALRNQLLTTQGV